MAQTDRIGASTTDILNFAQVYQADLKKFNRDIYEKVEEIKSNMKSIGQVWRDDNYERLSKIINNKLDKLQTQIDRLIFLEEPVREVVDGFEAALNEFDDIEL